MLISCCHASAQGIYSPNREFVYGTTYINGSDTTFGLISLQTVDSLWKYDNSQKVLQYHRYPSGGVMETTSYIENDKTVWLHPPRSGHFAMLEYFPFPEITRSAKCGRRYSRWFVGHIDFLDRFAVLRYKIRTQCEGDTTIITARSRSGRWNATYHFTPTEGFTLMTFSYDTISLALKLIEICE